MGISAHEFIKVSMFFDISLLDLKEAVAGSEIKTFGSSSLSF